MLEIRSGENPPSATDTAQLASADAASATDGVGPAERRTSAARVRARSRTTVIPCQGEYSLDLIGADTAVDGIYRIETATHKLDRSGESVTMLIVKQPQGEAGKGGRRNKSSSEAPARPDTHPSDPKAY